MKITANELRIGNYVWGVSDRIEQISEIQRDKVETTFRGHLYNYNLYCDISPIEITPEILEKAGFVSVGNTGTPDNWFSDEFGETNLMVRVGANGLVTLYIKAKELISLSNITYLHQLQNLYFALTQKELIISL